MILFELALTRGGSVLPVRLFKRKLQCIIEEDSEKLILFQETVTT